MTARVAPALTASAEDYLKAIYDLERTAATTDGTVGTNDIAQALGIAAASVTGMLQRLADHALLEYERYRGVRLTARGTTAALRTIRRHRVIEAYLAQALGYAWDRVHEEADRLEHAASDELVNRMAEAIGEPETDPHGAPIPGRDGTVATPVHRALADVTVDSVVIVREVGDRDAERLRYLAALGVTPGATVRVVSRAPFDGPIGLRIARGAGASRSRRWRTESIGPALAAEIRVEDAPKPARGAAGRGTRRPPGKGRRG